jgi:DNA-binding GntR family transcriptional regulator
MLRALVSSGDLATLSGAAIKVYLAIKAATDLGTGEALLDQPTLIQQTGLSLSHVKRAITELDQAGYLRRERQGRLVQYRITEKIPIADLNGTPSGQARWDYVPGAMHLVMREVKEVVTREILGDIPVVYITLQVNIAQDQASVINMQESLDKISDPDLRKAIMQAFSQRPETRLP